MVSQVNYNDPDSGQNKILFGSLGNLTLQENKYIVEFRNLTYKLTNKISEVFSKTCRVEFGSTKCGVVVDPAIWAASTEYCVGDVVRASTYDGRRYIVTVGGISGSTEPTWNTTIDVTTSDNEITWIAKEALRKEVSVYTPGKFRLYIKEARDKTNPSAGTVGIKEFSFFNTTPTRELPDSCVFSGTPLAGQDCDKLSDNTATSMASNGPMLDQHVEFTFNTPYTFSHFSIEVENNTYIVEFYLQISYDGGTTWSNIYEFTSGTSIYWQGINYTLITNSTDIEVFSKTKVPTDGTIFTDMDYVVDGVLTWTSGSNTGLSMEVTTYNTTTKELRLFNPMPYSIRYTDSYTILAGCNHLFLGSDGTTATGHCVSRYDNGDNFRGEPFVPTEDVLVGGIGETNKDPYTV